MDYKAAGCAIPPAPKELAIPLALECLKQVKQNLHERLSMLESRLSPLLRPEITNQCDKKAEPDRYSLADRINGTNDELREFIARINDLIDRLEI